MLAMDNNLSKKWTCIYVYIDDNIIIYLYIGMTHKHRERKRAFYVYIYINKNIHMCHAHFKQSHIHTCVYTNLTYMCPYIDTYIYIHIYIFIYIYISMWSQGSTIHSKWVEICRFGALLSTKNWLIRWMQDQQLIDKMTVRQSVMVWP